MECNSRIHKGLYDMGMVVCGFCIAVLDFIHFSLVSHMFRKWGKVVSDFV